MISPTLSNRFGLFGYMKINILLGLLLAFLALGAGELNASMLNKKDVKKELIQVGADDPHPCGTWWYDHQGIVHRSPC